MIGYLKGQVAMIHHHKNSVLLLVNQIGYNVFLTEKDRLTLHENCDTEVFTEMVVRENEISLYGFLHKEDLSMFSILNEVSGIGPRSAMNMISSVESPILAEAIISENINLLMKLPGIGKKTAQRIILDIKEKLQKCNDGNGNPKSRSISQNNQNQACMTTVFDTLSALGYSDQEIISILPEIDKTENLTEQELVKAALKIFAQKK